MSLIADGLLIAAAFGAAFYCWALNRRLLALKNSGSGLVGQFEGFAENIAKAQAVIAQSRDLADSEKLCIEALLAEAETLRKELRRAQTDLMRERTRKANAVDTLQKFARRGHRADGASVSGAT